MSIIRPVTAQPHGTQGRISQEFAGQYKAEAAGYLRDGLPVRRAKRGWLRRARKLVHLHAAIDYSTAIGTPVYAVHDGVILGQGRYAYTGEWYLLLRVKVGRTKQLVAFYTHLRHDSFRFKVGDHVKRGQVLAKTGDSGWSTGPHLHFELGWLYRWQRVTFHAFYHCTKLDPQPFINGKHLKEVV